MVDLIYKVVSYLRAIMNYLVKSPFIPLSRTFQYYIKPLGTSNYWKIYYQKNLPFLIVFHPLLWLQKPLCVYYK